MHGWTASTRTAFDRAASRGAVRVRLPSGPSGRENVMQGRRYIVHFSDGGAGPRYFDTQLEVGAELREGDARYVVERVG